MSNIYSFYHSLSELLILDDDGLMGDSSKSSNLINIATNTGGTFYHADSATDVVTHMYTIQTNTLWTLNTVDSDNDGLYDVMEQSGMLLPNGKIIYTDPYLKDSDIDDLTDYNEMGGDKSFNSEIFLKKK